MIPAIDALIGTAPAPPALLLAKARASYVLGRLEEGLAAIDEISIPAGHPQAGQVAWWKGRMLIRAGRLDEARTTAEGLALRPRMRAMARVQLAEISMLEGDLESACEQLSALLDREGPVGPRFDAAFLLARGLDRLGRHEEAFKPRPRATGCILAPLMRRPGSRRPTGSSPTTLPIESRMPAGRGRMRRRSSSWECPGAGPRSWSRSSPAIPTEAGSGNVASPC